MGKNREGQHKVGPTATQTCANVHKGHTFPLYKKATARKKERYRGVV